MTYCTRAKGDAKQLRNIKRIVFGVIGKMRTYSRPKMEILYVKVVIHPRNQDAVTTDEYVSCSTKLSDK